MKQEFILLLKQPSIVILVIISLLLSSLSLLNGWQNIQHMRTQIEHAQAEEQRQHASQLEQLRSHREDGKIDAGEVGYYVFHHVYQHPNEWSFIALGNRLVTPYVQRVRLLGLQSQIYDGESHHPEYVMLGAFDYAFWLVFFLPLVCIAFMHDLKASEIQAQRAIFLGTMAISPRRFWGKRILLRWFLVFATFMLPVVIFACLLGLAISLLIQVTIVTLIYSLFWTIICVMISLRDKAHNANFNAMLLASIWLCICVILPNLAQLWLHKEYPVQDGSQIALQHRQLIHNAWDLPKKDTLDPFYEHYPEWANTPAVTGRFHWKWYYAFQHMADVNLANQVEQREHNLRLRDNATASLSYLLPSLWTQRQLESVAKSNVLHLLDHRQNITDYHTKLRHTLYPFLFKGEAMRAEDFANLPKFQMNDLTNQ